MFVLVTSRFVDPRVDRALARMTVSDGGGERGIPVSDKVASRVMRVAAAALTVSVAVNTVIAFLVRSSASWIVLRCLVVVWAAVGLTVVGERLAERIGAGNK